MIHGSVDTVLIIQWLYGRGYDYPASIPQSHTKDIFRQFMQDSHKALARRISLSTDRSQIIRRQKLNL